jgi:hypothetical protein
MIILDTDAITFLERRESRESMELRARLTAASAEHEIVTTVAVDAQHSGFREGAETDGEGLDVRLTENRGSALARRTSCAAGCVRRGRAA